MTFPNALRRGSIDRTKGECLPGARPAHYLCPISSPKFILT